MEAAISPLPDDVEALKALLVSALQKADEAEARLANAHARESATAAVIAHLKLEIARLWRDQYGASAERTALLMQSTGLLYTPDREHFGIVPIEVALLFVILKCMRHSASHHLFL